MILILLLTALAEGLVVQFVPRPRPWLILIGMLYPIFTSVFVILPFIKDEKPAPPGI